MKTTFTKSTSKFGCYAENDNEQHVHLPNETFTITSVLNADVPLKDKAWFIHKNCEFTDMEFRQFAIGCALIVLPIYETKYPYNKAPREAIEAAQQYLAGTIDIYVLREKRKAAYATYAFYTEAAEAAYTTHAYAVYAAYASSHDATEAAYISSSIAADAADAGNYKDQLLQFFKDFTSDKEPYERSEGR